MPLLNHSSEEVLIFSRKELWPERLLPGQEQFPLQQHIAGPSFAAVNDESGRIGWTFVEFAINYPSGRLLIEMGLHRPKHSVHLIFLANFKERQKPAPRWIKIGRAHV